MFLAKKIAFIFTLITLLFGMQSKSLAAYDHDFILEPTVTISLSENPQIQFFNKSSYLVDATDIENFNIDEWLWVPSIFIPGLSHLIMGEAIGFLYFFAITSLTFIITMAYAAPAIIPHTGQDFSYSGPNLLGISIQLIIAGLYIWNVLDAYLLNSRILSKKAEKSKNQTYINAQIIAESMKNYQLTMSREGVYFQSLVTDF